MRKSPSSSNAEDLKQRMATVANEVNVLAKLSGSLNVVNLYSACEDDDYVYIVMELCKGGELWHKFVLGIPFFACVSEFVE